MSRRPAPTLGGSPKPKEADPARIPGRIRAIFFDIDGTLYSHTTCSVPDSTLFAFDQLKEQGILRVIATGRAPQELDVLPLERLAPDALILLNGMLAIDAGGQVEISHVLAKPQKQQLLEVFAAREIPIALVEKDRMYLNFCGPAVTQAQQAVQLVVPEIADWQGGEVYMGVGFVDAQTRIRLEQMLPDFQVTAWNDYGVDIVPHTAGKAAAIDEWAALHGLKKEELAAFGDGENDIEMLGHVGVGIAMGNAKEAVKAAADLVCPSIDDDGLYAMLCRLGWIEPDAAFHRRHNKENRDKEDDGA